MQQVMVQRVTAQQVTAQQITMTGAVALSAPLP